MAGNNDILRIAAEITTTLRSLADSNRAILQYMQRPDVNNGQPNGGNPRRGPNNNSPSSQMNINRRLTGSIINLTTNVTRTSAEMAILARSIRIANRQLLGALRNNNGNPPPGGGGNGGGNGGGGPNPRPNPRPNPPGGGNPRPPQPSGLNDNDPTPNNFMRSLMNSFSGLSIGKGLSQANSEFRLAASRGGMYDLDTQTDSIVMGMSATDLIEMQSNFRSTIMKSSGGIDGWTANLKNSQIGLIAYTGSLKDANILQATALQNVTNMGFTFDEAVNIVGDSRNGLIGSFVKLQNVTGKTAKELAEVVNSVVTSEDAKDNLRKMDRNQRANYVLTQGKMLEHFTNLTGSLTRAQEIVTAMQARTKEDPMSRYKSSFKMMQAAVLSGMDNDSAKRLQQLHAMNPTALLKDPALVKQYKDLAGQLNQNVTSMRGNEKFVNEYLGYFLSEYAQIEKLLAYNPELDTPNKVTNVKEQESKSISKTIDDSDLLQKAVTAIDMGNSILNNILYVITGSLIAKGASSLVRLGIGVATPPGGGPVPPVPPGGGAGGILGRLSMARNLLGIGAIAGGAGLAIDHFVKPESEIGEKAKNVTSTALEYAGIAMSIGAVAGGPIGAAVGAAVGGLAGAIVGLSQNVKSQAMYNAEDQNQRLEADLQFLKNKHDKEMKELDVRTEELKTLRDNAEGNQRDIYDRELSLIEEKRIAEEELFQVRMSDANNLHLASQELVNSLQKKDDISVAIKEAFESQFMGIGKQFDTEEFLDATKMSSQDLISNIMEHAPNITPQAFQDLRKQIMNKEDITSEQGVRIMKEVTSSMQKQADDMSREKQKLFEEKKSKAQKSSSDVDKNLFTLEKPQLKDHIDSTAAISSASTSASIASSMKNVLSSTLPQPIVTSISEPVTTASTYEPTFFKTMDNVNPLSALIDNNDVVNNRNNQTVQNGFSNIDQQQADAMNVLLTPLQQIQIAIQKQTDLYSQIEKDKQNQLDRQSNQTSFGEFYKKNPYENNKTVAHR